MSDIRGASVAADAGGLDRAAVVRFAARVADLRHQQGAAPAARFGGRDVPWAELLAPGTEVVAFLEGCDVPSGARIGVLTRERPEVLGIVASLLASGRPPALISALQPVDSVVRAIDDLGLAGLVALADDWERSELAGAVATRAASVVVDGSVVRGGRGEASARSAPDGVALSVMTSGTTGPPKPVDVTWATLRQILDRPPGDPSAARGALINTLPLSSIGGAFAMVTSVWTGRPMALMERFDVDEWIALVREFRPRRCGGPPAVLRMLLDADVPDDTFASVTCFETGSAPASPELVEEFESTFGVPVLCAYGATEFLGAVASWTLADHSKWAEIKRGSVGRATVGFRLRVVDEGGAEVAPGEQGRLEVRSERSDNGWIATNDLAVLDVDGFLFIGGRLDDVVVRGGFKVDPGTVERALEERADVSEAAVIGVLDERVGEVPVALVVGASDALASEESIRTWMRGRVPAYAVPTRVLQVSSLPRNSMMKLDRRQARDQARRLLEDQR